MRIDHVKLVRFGEFCDREVEGFQPGLNVLFGPNETGKSTLLGAVRFLLFGAALGDYRVDGNRQVEARLWQDKCPWVLTRGDGRGRGAFQLRPAEGGAPVLLQAFGRDWLGETSLATYKSVYALGLDDLKLDTELTEAILVHADPMGQRLRQAIAETARSAEALLAPAARKPVNAALGEWKGADDEVLRLSHQPRDLNEKEQALRAAEEQVGRLDGEIRELRRQQDQCKEVLEAREAWEQAVILRRQCEDRAEVADFPPTAVPEYRAAKQRGDEARVRAEEAREQAGAAAGQLEALEIDQALLDQGDTVEKLAEESAQHHDLPGRLQEAARKAAAALDAAQKELADRCGHEATVTTIRALNTSAAVQSELDARAASLNQAGVKREQAGAAARTAELERDRTLAEVTQGEESLRALPEPPDIVALRAGQEHLGSWRLIYGELRLAQEKHQAARDRHEELVARRKAEVDARAEAEAQARAWEDGRARLDKENAAAHRRRQAIPGALGLLFLVGGFAAPALGQPTWATALFACAAACAAFVILARTSSPQAVAQPTPPLPTVTVAADHVQASASALSQIATGLETLHARLAAAARHAGLPEGADAESAAQLDHDLKAQVDAAQVGAVRRAQVEAQLDEARKLHKGAVERLLHYRTDEKGAQEAAAAAERSWHDLLLRQSIPADLGPDAARTYLDGARAVKASLHEYDAQATQAAGLRERLAGFRKRAGALAAALGAEVAEDDPWALRAARQWSERLKEHRDGSRRRSELAAALEEAEAQRRKAEADETAAAAAMRQALERARAADEDGLLRRSEAHTDWTRLDGDLRQAENQLRGLRSDEEWQAFRERLEQADWTALQSEATSLADREQGLRDERDRALETIGHLQKEIDKLRQDEALADAQARREQARARVVELGRRWASDAAAHALLALTRARFEAERQPEAVRRTGALFGELTDGRWGDIVARDGGVSVSRPGVYGPIERDPERLSRGARDALMLCARLAAIEQAVERFPLPVVLDDALVNLDRRRHERALRIIARMAERTQVLLFTCHEHTVAQLATAGIPHHLVELGSARVELPLLPGTPPGRDEGIESEGKRL